MRQSLSDEIESAPRMRDKCVSKSTTRHESRVEILNGQVETLARQPSLRHNAAGHLIGGWSCSLRFGLNSEQALAVAWVAEHLPGLI